MFETESEVLQFLSLCSQLTATASDKDITKQLDDNIRTRPVEIQAQADSARQTVQDAAQSATQNITLHIQAGLISSQQYASTLNVSYQQAQTCLSQQAEQYATIASASRK